MRVLFGPAGGRREKLKGWIGSAGAHAAGTMGAKWGHSKIVDACGRGGCCLLFVQQLWLAPTFNALHTHNHAHTLTTQQDGTPLKLHSVGQDFFQGSHYDEYLYMWSSFKPGPVDPSVFDLPQICKDLPPTTTTSKVKKQEGDTDKGERQEGEREEEEEEEERAAAAATSGGGGVVLARDGGAGGRHHQVMQAIALLPGNHPEHAGVEVWVCGADRAAGALDRGGGVE